ncbi:hypothetical protein Tco_0573763, partial [Tanacetum coccineum]
MIVAHTITQSEENNLTSIETTGVKEVEMVDAESTQGSVKQGIKEVEMKDAEIVLNETCIEENITKDERPVDVRDAKAKLEVDVKVKKMDQGDSKENSKVDNYTQTAARMVIAMWKATSGCGKYNEPPVLGCQRFQMGCQSAGWKVTCQCSIKRTDTDDVDNVGVNHNFHSQSAPSTYVHTESSFSWGLVGGEGACPKVSERSLNNEYDQSNGNAYHV